MKLPERQAGKVRTHTRYWIQQRLAIVPESGVHIMAERLPRWISALPMSRQQPSIVSAKRWHITRPQHNARPDLIAAISVSACSYTPVADLRVW